MDYQTNEVYRSFLSVNLQLGGVTRFRQGAEVDRCYYHYVMNMVAMVLYFQFMINSVASSDIEAYEILQPLRKLCILQATSSEASPSPTNPNSGKGRGGTSDAAV